MNEYRSLMNEVDLPDRVHDAVMKETRQADAASSQAHHRASTSTIRTMKPQRMKPLARAAVAACLVIVTGFGATTVATGLLDEKAFAENSFALAAYAAENPNGKTGEPEVLNADDFGWGGYSGAYYDPDTRTFAAYDEWAGYKYGFNVTCTGNNIERVDYEIHGERAYFETIDNERASRPPTQEEIDSGDASTFHYTKTTSFDYTDQHSITDERTVSIYLGFPVPDDAREAFHRSQEGTQDRHLFYEYSTSIGIAAARTLANCRLTLTATFADGSTQTKEYVIEPVADFDQQYAAFWEESYEWSLKYDTGNPFDEAPAEEHPTTPPLYTITEITEP